MVSLLACSRTEEPVINKALDSYVEDGYYFRGYTHYEKPTGISTSESVFETETIMRNFPGTQEWDAEEIANLNQLFVEMIDEIVELTKDDEFTSIDPFTLDEEGYIFMLKNSTYEVFFLDDNLVAIIDSESNHEYLTYKNGGYVEVFESYAAKFRDAIDKHFAKK